MSAAIREVDGSAVSAREFHEEIVPAGTPLVLRGVAAEWPAVRAANRGDQALCDYLLQFDRGQPMRAMLGPPRIQGRFFYNPTVTGFNFRTESIRLDAALDLLLDNAEDPQPTALAIQSTQIWSALPGFERENNLLLLPPSVEPRAWLGNRVTVAAHHDPSENVATVVAGRRRFTLFAPDQVANLYPGPFDPTPAGPTISMVDFDAPDFDLYPRFGDALDAALTAELGPGDAIYIPYLWWHHVRSTEPLNLLINYWWSPPASTSGYPLEAMLHALASVRGLPPPARAAWKVMFDHYVFGDASTGAHLPADAQGILADTLDARSHEWVRQLLEGRYGSK
jgi:hypothetical protein